MDNIIFKQIIKDEKSLGEYFLPGKLTHTQYYHHDNFFKPEMQSCMMHNWLMGFSFGTVLTKKVYSETNPLDIDKLNTMIEDIVSHLVVEKLVLLDKQHFDNPGLSAKYRGHDMSWAQYLLLESWSGFFAIHQHAPRFNEAIGLTNSYKENVYHSLAISFLYQGRSNRTSAMLDILSALPIDKLLEKNIDGQTPLDIINDNIVQLKLNSNDSKIIKANEEMAVYFQSLIDKLLISKEVAVLPLNDVNKKMDFKI